MRQRRLYFIAFIGWIMAILVMVGLSLVSWAAPPEKYHIDKMLHAAAFFGLTVSILWFIQRLSITLLVCMMMAAIGGAIELLQNSIPRRNGTWEDLVADFIGILLALCLARLYHYRKQK